MAIPAIAWVFIAAGTFTVGAISRQPEINKLHANSKKLHAEMEKLRKIIDEQDRQINVLKMKYTALSGIFAKGRAEARGKVKEAISFGYALNEYMELVYKFVNGPENISEEERRFVVAFENIRNNTIPHGENIKDTKDFVVSYTRSKYAKQIAKMINCDFSEIYHKLDMINNENTQNEPETTSNSDTDTFDYMMEASLPKEVRLARAILKAAGGVENIWLCNKKMIIGKKKIALYICDVKKTNKTELKYLKEIDVEYRFSDSDLKKFNLEIAMKLRRFYGRENKITNPGIIQIKLSENYNEVLTEIENHVKVVKTPW